MRTTRAINVTISEDVLEAVEKSAARKFGNVDVKLSDIIEAALEDWVKKNA